MKKNVAKIILKMWVKNVFSSIKAGSFFLLCNPRVNTTLTIPGTYKDLGKREDEPRVVTKFHINDEGYLRDPHKY
jgi:hypothetical protein